MVIPLAGLKVLVVDDETDSREMVAQVLSEAHATLVTAGSADEGLALVMSERPDILISDIGMPDKDGYELLRELRKRPARPRWQDPGDRPDGVRPLGGSHACDARRLPGPHRQADRAARVGRHDRQPRWTNPVH